MNTTIEIDDTSYEVLQSFGFIRCLIRYDGLAVFADRGPITGAWVLSGTPAATPDEKRAIDAFMPTDEVTVVPE